MLRSLPDVGGFLRCVYVGGAGDADLDGVVDGIRQQTDERRGRALPGMEAVRTGCNSLMNCGGDLFVADFDEHLGVVQLLQLWRCREPEARPASTNEGW